MLLLAPAFLAMATQGRAANKNLTMGVTLTNVNYCQIVLLNSGTIVTNAAGTVFNSKLAGGAPGQVDVTTTNGSYRFYYDLPSSFASEPVGNSGAATFFGTYSGTGATNFTNRNATKSRKLKKGVTNISADLRVTNGGNAFVAGDYTATTTVRCE